MLPLCVGKHRALATWALQRDTDRQPVPLIRPFSFVAKTSETVPDPSPGMSTGMVKVPVGSQIGQLVPKFSCDSNVGISARNTLDCISIRYDMAATSMICLTIRSQASGSSSEIKCYRTG